MEERAIGTFSDGTWQRRAIANMVFEHRIKHNTPAEKAVREAWDAADAMWAAEQERLTKEQKDVKADGKKG